MIYKKLTSKFYAQSNKIAFNFVRFAYCMTVLQLFFASF